MRKQILAFDEDGIPISGAGLRDSARIIQRQLFGIDSSVFWNRVLLLSVLLLMMVNIAVTVCLLCRQ